ncbi:MAG: sugar-binding domain-containing protein, partial [bacterium]
MRLTSAISLNGTWQMQRESTGLDRPKGDRWANAPVPMPWSAFYTVPPPVPPELVPDRMAWFRRTIPVPELEPFTRLMLHFEAVNFYAIVFVNGRRCGEHVGDAVPFDIDLTEFVTPGEPARLLVGVQDISYAEARRPEPAGRRLVYPGLPHQPGIWGDVSLRLLSELHIVSVDARTTLPEQGPGVGGAEIAAAVSIKNETGRALRFVLTNEVYDGTRQALAFNPVRGTLDGGELARFEMSAGWEAPTLWWPDAPHRYVLRSALWSTMGRSRAGDVPGDVVDRVHTPFGFREFRADGTAFTLNATPVQLRSESVSPISGRLISELGPGEPDEPAGLDEARDLLATLKAERGINAVRFHRVPPAAALLDAADRVGLLTIVEFPLPDDQGHYAVEDSQFWVNTERLARNWVDARSRHPSVVIWSVDQGMVGRYGRAAVEGLRSLARAVADRDPSRPVENSGDGDSVAADDLGVSSPVSAFFPRAGVAFRSGGPYEPEEVRGRVLPLPRQVDGHWLPARPADQPLCLLEHARRTATPNELAFFLGDAAYTRDAPSGPAAASLAMLEMGALRVAGLAAVHTIGRPPAPEGAADAAADLVALPTT